MIVIIDYGVGNVGSVLNMVRKVGGDAIITSEIEIIEKASAIILPGVGAFDEAMEKLNSTGLIPVIERRVLIDKVPFLGICLGMQLLFKSSEEGSLAGLGWLDGDVKKFRFQEEESKLKVPHMGWNEIVPELCGSNLYLGLLDHARFYFVHTYHVVCDNEIVAATASYGYPFVCSVVKGNIHAAQFHPEKSHRFGMQFFKNFIEIAQC